MRASVPALILAFTLASPLLARDGPPRRAGEAQISQASAHDREAAPVPAAGRTSRLSYANADRTEAREGDCAAACAPQLAYAPVALSDDLAAPPILASSTPASLTFLEGRNGGDGVMLLDALPSDGPAERTLAGLVTIGAPAAAPAPVRFASPPHTLAPAPAPLPPARPLPPICPIETSCS